MLLRDLLIPSVGASAAVDAEGPEGSPQDFRLPPCALEVKCSRAKAGGKISISNEQQLDERPFPHLVLVHVAWPPGAAPTRRWSTSWQRSGRCSDDRPAARCVQRPADPGGVV